MVGTAIKLGTKENTIIRTLCKRFVIPLDFKSFKNLLKLMESKNICLQGLNEIFLKACSGDTAAISLCDNNR